MTIPLNAFGLPSAHGLYDPRFEHDACGVSFVADIHGRASHDIVMTGLGALCNLEHRGATGAEVDTGDGAGVLLQVPDRFFRGVVTFELPPVGQRDLHLCAIRNHMIVGYHETGRVHEDGQPGPLKDLLGQRLRNFDGMRPGLTCRAGGHEVVTWAECYEVLSGEALVTYDDGPMQGEAAVVRNGNAVTIGTWSPSLVRETLAALLTEAGIRVMDLPDGVRVSRRGSSVTWMNFNQHPAPMPDGTMLPPVSFEVRVG